MLSLGACVVGNPEENFYVEIKPTSKEFLPDALKVSGFNLDRLEQDGQPPVAAMKSFKQWVETALSVNLIFEAESVIKAKPLRT